MHNPLKDLDQIKVSNETKDKTLSYVLQHKKKRNYTLWFLPTFAVIGCILLFVVQSNTFAPKENPNNQEILSYVSIDINPSLQFSLDSNDTIIAVSGLNDDAKSIIDTMNIKNRTLLEALPVLFSNTAFQPYLKDGIIEVGVYSNNNDTSSRIENEVNSYLQQHVDAGSYHCSSIDQSIVNGAKTHHTSLGKYRVIDMILMYDTSKSIEELKQLSIKELYLILGKYDSSAIPANCHQDENQRNKKPGNGKHRSSGHH